VVFQLTVTLDAGVQASEVVTVSSLGRRVGTLTVDTASPTAGLHLHGREGTVAYELDVAMVLVDGSRLSCAGQGSITAFEGATFAVRVDRVGPGCTAFLE